MITCAAIAFSRGGETLACCNRPEGLLDTRNREVKKTLKSVIGDVMSVAFSPDGRTLAGGRDDNTLATMSSPWNGTVSLWDLPTGTLMRTLKGPTHIASSVAFSPNGRTVAAGGPGPPKKGRNKFTGEPAMTTVSEVRLLDVATRTRTWTAVGETDSALSLSLSQGGKPLAFCDQDHVYLINADTGRRRQTVK
jgi:WD40 repeat protein